jgi:hypothetical protein
MQHQAALQNITVQMQKESMETLNEFNIISDLFDQRYKVFDGCIIARQNTGSLIN